MNAVNTRGRERMHRRTRRGLGIAAACALTASAVLAGGSPANAAPPECIGYGLYPQGLARVWAPADSQKNWRCALRQGDGWYSAPSYVHKGVKRLQEDLNFCYPTVLGSYFPLSTDGVFGSRTRNALIKVQSHLNISADGIYGPQTAAAMNHFAESTTPYGWMQLCLRLP